MFRSLSLAAAFAATIAAISPVLGQNTAPGNADPSALSLLVKGSLQTPTLVHSVAASPDSKTVFVGLNDGTVVAYDLLSRKPLDIAHRTYSTLQDMVLNSQGDRLALGYASGMVAVLDPSTLKPLKQARLPKSVPSRLVFSRDGKSLFVGALDGHVHQIRMADFVVVKDIPPSDDSSIQALACSADGKIAASYMKKSQPQEKSLNGEKKLAGKIRLWSEKSLELLKEWNAHEEFASSLAFDPSGEHLISGGAESTVKVWRLSDLVLVSESNDYHQLAISTIAFTPNGIMITGGYDGLCQFWSAKTFTALKSYPNYRGYIKASAVSPDGRWLVRGGTSLDFVSLSNPEEVERVAEFGGAILGLAATQDRKRLVTGGLDRRLNLWEIDKKIDSKSALLEDWITAIDFSKNDELIVAGLMNGRIVIVSSTTLQHLKSWVAHEGRITGVATVDGKLISIGDDGVIRVWSFDGKRLQSFDEKSPCRALAVLGTQIAVGTASGSISVKDLASDSPIRRIKGRPFSVTALEFAENGKRLVVGYFDGDLQSIDTQLWSETKFLAGKGDSVLSISANPANNSLIAVGFRDGNARLIDSGTFRIGPTFSSTREIFSTRWALEENTLAITGASNEVTFLKVAGDIPKWTREQREQVRELENVKSQYTPTYSIQAKAGATDQVAAPTTCCPQPCAARVVYFVRSYSPFGRLRCRLLIR